MFRLFAYCVGGLVVAVSFFFGTLALLNAYDVRQRDALRVEHVRILERALEKYRAAKGVFPGPYADSSVDDLRDQLVGGGFINSLPHDPLATQSYRYTTAGVPNGQRYGLKISREGTGDCLTGVGSEGSGWWAPIQQCPF